MRLVDIDNNNLRDAIWKAKLDTREKVDGLLDCVPTVEAIPIGWIYLWRLKNMDKCPVDYISFSDLLNDWEKENVV